MTSGNVSGEPIVAGNEEARLRLRGIADGFLLHDREIAARCDDSVVRMVDGAPIFLRRARGYVPSSLTLPMASPRPLLGVGPFTLAVGNTAFVSQHVGDLGGQAPIGTRRRASRPPPALDGARRGGRPRRRFPAIVLPPILGRCATLAARPLSSWPWPRSSV